MGNIESNFPANLHMRAANEYAHGIDIDDFYPCWNLSLCGTLWSPDFAAHNDAGLRAVHTPLREISLEDLQNGNFQSGVLAPRAANTIFLAAFLRQNRAVTDGLGSIVHYGEEVRANILKKADIELEFENVRRRKSPESATRLSSIYLADNSEVGIKHIENMLGSAIFVIRVSILSAKRLTRADTRWFDLYIEDEDIAFIENYWRGIPSECPKWEYLLDGAIQMTDQSQLEEIRDVVVHLQIA